jgi:hypothetical protein
MSKPLWFSEEKTQQWKKQAKQVQAAIRKSNILFFAVALIVFGMLINLWDNQTTSYAKAYTGNSTKTKTFSPIFGEKKMMFDELVRDDNQVIPFKSELLTEAQVDGKTKSDQFAQKIYELVGETPIKEMVPFISQRDERVAAFLIGIAKKESSFGLASPLKDGETCYNYWGYKGSGGRGTGMGYACFASPEEAIQVVGDRIEVLVNKERNTPARMVDTWKCGTSCKGDPGAQSWVATVALYFEKLVG